MTTFEYLLVTFSEHRTVLANDLPVGVTNHIILLPPGDYTIKLDGGGYTPDHQDIELDGTSPVRPCVVVFQAAK
ncbi:MAG: hypothetical protein JO227_05660 [Acetobacteraceae bacterium]|nr:hypothetical protein [Acetobacteraceae bacterium]